MVKADLTRDYYGDLELAPNADTAEIKKQFKKLALTYHPDRNPGREGEVTAKFQKIQSAHEVLTDPSERAKYDANRIRVPPGSFRNSYGGGQASGMRGNPWSNAGSQWAPPPKPPTARTNRAQPPPPSTGAGRYAKFTPPNATPYQSAQEGPQARKAQYEAWDKTRHAHQSQSPSQNEYGPGKSWKAPQPPPRGTPTSGREESNAKFHGPPPKARPGFDEFRESGNSHGRSQSTNGASRKGFMPNTPGGDEPPAPRGAYSTQRDKPTVAPEPPPRKPVPTTAEGPRPSTGRADPLKKFRMDPPMEERVSTPYATHGGEKFNPFESAAANMNRSKSTRERSEAFGKDDFPRAGSDTNLKSKNNTAYRAHSFAEPKQAPRPSYSESINISSSDDEPIHIAKPFTRATRRSNGTSQKDTNQAGSFTDPETKSTSKQSRIQQMRHWMRENPGQEPPPNGFGADGPPLRSGQPTPKANGEPSMYASPFFSTPNHRPTPTAFDQRHPSSFSVKQETKLSETIHPSQSRSSAYHPSAVVYPDLSGAPKATPPSGVPTSPNSLNAFEEMQRSFVDQLLSIKRQRQPSMGHQCQASNGDGPMTGAGSQPQKSMDVDDKWTKYREPYPKPGSPAKQPRTIKHLKSTHAFSFNVNDETFARSQPKANGFSNSAENISTKFTPEDWDGKFAAGTSYFQPDPKAPGSPRRPRSQSTSRSRGRSPIKVQPPFAMPPRSEEQTPIESPGGTKFSAKDWAETFKPQTFMPPPMTGRPNTGRKRSLRPTMGGNAAVVDESDTPDEKPLFAGRKNVSPAKSPPTVSTSPEPMDVDTPPAHNTAPQFAKAKVNGKLNTEPLKRPAASASASPVDPELKLAFEDLKVKDIISTLDMPTPPSAPAPPATEKDIPTRAAYDDYLHRYGKYIREWDLFNARFLIHVVARKNQNDAMKERRWLDDRGLEIYRLGLKEDQVVMQKWAEHTSVHETAVKCFVIMKERMRAAGDAGTEPKRPRKKTH